MNAHSDTYPAPAPGSTGYQSQPTITRRDVPEYLESCKAFRAGNMSAVTDSSGTYRVFSYAQEIARVEQRSDGLHKFVNPHTYSVTTTRHQRAAERHLPGKGK